MAIRTRERAYLIALVWSMTDDLAVMPYAISRHGTRQDEGGTGVTWTCTCPHYVHRGSTCKHLRILFASVQRGTLDPRYTLTDRGRELITPALAKAIERRQGR